MSGYLEEVINGTKRGYKRLSVDVGQTGFFEGREARSFFEGTITGLTEIIIKAVVPVDIILQSISVFAFSGDLKVSTLLSDGTEGGVFSTLLPIIPTNTMLEKFQPPYIPQVILSTGGTYNGGTQIDVFRLKTGTGTGPVKVIPVGANQDDIRGVITGTYYYRFKALSVDDVEFIFNGRWEERA